MPPTSYGTISLVLVVMAASSLFSMMGLVQVDRIVHQDLYRYGLQFSYEWASSYWTTMKLAFAMGWLNIIAAITFQLHMVIQSRREVKLWTSDVEKEILKSKFGYTDKTGQPTAVEEKPLETIDTAPVTQGRREESQNTVESPRDQEPAETARSREPIEQEEQVTADSHATLGATEEKTETEPEPHEETQETPPVSEGSEEELEQTADEDQEPGTSIL